MVYFVPTSHARGIEPVLPTRTPHKTYPRIMLGGPKELTHQEALSIGDALRLRHADVDVMRITDDFRIADFANALQGCGWLLLAIGMHPLRELEMLREAERAMVPKIGIICLADSVAVSQELHEGGRIDVVVKRTPGDRSFSSPSRSMNMLLIRDLNNEQELAALARMVIPVIPD